MVYVARLEQKLVRCWLDFLLVHLEVGKHINWILWGLPYADDIVRAAESVNDLQPLLDIYREESPGLGLQFNVNISAAVVFAGSPNITLGDLRLGEDNMPVLITTSNPDDYLKEHDAYLRQPAV